MTGTPLQNNTQELWSLLHYIEPTKFPDMEKFNERYGKVETVEQVQQLQKRLEPHLLRRTKEDVATDIPAKEETIIDVELTTLQKQYYRAIFERYVPCSPSLPLSLPNVCVCDRYPGEGGDNY